MPTSPVNPLSPATKRFTESPSKFSRPISRALVMAQDTGGTGSRDLGSVTAAAVAAATAAAAEVDDEGVLAKVGQSEAEDDIILVKVDQSEAENDGIGRAVEEEQYAGVERVEDVAYADTDAGSDFAVDGKTVSATRLDTGKHSESAFSSAPGEAEIAESREFGGVVAGVRPEERMANGRKEAIAALDLAEGGGAPGDAEKGSVSAMVMSTSEDPSPSKAAVISNGVDNGADGNALADESVQSTVVEGATAHHSSLEIEVPKYEPPVVDSLHAERQEAWESPDVSVVNAVPTVEATAASVVVAVADQTEAAVIEAETGNQTEVDQPKASEGTEVGDKASAEEDAQGVAETAIAAAAAPTEEAVSIAYEAESGAQSEPAASESAGPIVTAPLETPPPQTTIDADMDVLQGAVEPTSIEVLVTADAAKPTTFEVDAMADTVESVAGLGEDKRVRIPGELPSTEGQRRSSAGDRSPQDRGLFTAGKVEVGTATCSVVCVFPQVWFACKTR